MSEVEAIDTPPAMTPEDVKAILEETLNQKHEELASLKKNYAQTLDLLETYEDYKALIVHPGYKRLVKSMENYFENQIGTAGAPTDASWETFCQFETAQRRCWKLVMDNVKGRAGKGPQDHEKWKEIKKLQAKELKEIEAAIAHAEKALAGEAVN
jgi:hypothetical protein